MIRFLSDKIQFTRLNQKLGEILDVSTPFEENPFAFFFKNFKAFEFDFIFHESFFKGLKNFLREQSCDQVIFYTINPEPVEYFHERYGKYNILEISMDTSYEELDQMMMQAPREEFGDALALASNDIVWFSESRKWAIVGSRDWEVAIIGLVDEETEELFISSFGASADMFFSVKEQIEIYEDMFEFTSMRRIAYDKIIENYENKV